MGYTDRLTNWRTDICKTIYPHFFKGGHNKRKSVSYIMQWKVIKVSKLCKCNNTLISLNRFEQIDRHVKNHKVSDILPRSASVSGGGVFLCRLLSVRALMLLPLLLALVYQELIFPWMLFHLCLSWINLWTV